MDQHDRPLGEHAKADKYARQDRITETAPIGEGQQREEERKYEERQQQIEKDQAGVDDEDKRFPA